ncbi:hypothetical protein D3C81_2009590 [compost metagenome]
MVQENRHIHAEADIDQSQSVGAAADMQAFGHPGQRDHDGVERNQHRGDEQ